MVAKNFSVNGDKLDINGNFINSLEKHGDCVNKAKNYKAKNKDNYQSNQVLRWCAALEWYWPGENGDAKNRKQILKDDVENQMGSFGVSYGGIEQEGL